MKDSLKIMLFVQILLVITVVLDVLIVRQVSSFIWLSFFPGYLIIKILRIDFKKEIDVFLFSFGVSIGFLMIMGLLMNELYPLIGILRPLSLSPILITLSCINLIFIFINLKQDLIISEKDFHFESKKKYSYFLFLIIPPLSGIIGALYKNNYLLTFMIFIISICFLLLAFMNKYIPKNMYPFIIYSISIALIFHTSLISNYLIGDDINIEYQVFKITNMNSFWDLSYFRNVTSYRNINNYNAMLSTTILPTIYSVILNIKEDVFLKIVSPLMLSFIPIILYRFYEKEFGSKIAIFSVFFFMSDATTFFGISPVNLNRQIFAELFFILSIFILFHDDDIDKRKGQFLFLFFGSLVIVSHYVTSYFYIFYLAVLYIFLRKNSKNSILNSTSFVFLVLTKLSWDVFISITNISILDHLIRDLYDRFIIDFLNPVTRSPDIQRLISPSGSIITQLHRVVFYLVHLLLFFGIIEVFRKRKTSYIDKKYRILALFAFLNIIFVVLVPNLTNFFNLWRFRLFAMFFLTPLIIIGGKSIIEWMNRTLVKIIKISFHIPKNDLHLKIISLILISYFLFNVGFVNYVMEVKPISNSLDINRMKTSNDTQILTDFYGSYIAEQDFFSTVWLSNNVPDKSIIYADHTSRWHVLHSYGMFSSDRVYPLFNSTKLRNGEYIYLNHLNSVEGIITRSTGTYPISEITSLLDDNNKIYSNGDNEIYLALEN